MKRETLLKAIEYILPGVDKPGSPLGMDFLLFDKGWLRSFNDAVSVSFFAESPKSIQCAVKVLEFYKVLSKMEEEDVKISLEDKKLIIKSSKTTLRMVLMEEKQLDLFKERIISLNTEELKWKKIPKGLMEGLDLCSSGTTENIVLGVMASIFFSKNQIYSTDSHRISIYTMEGEISSDFLLPVEVTKGVIKYGMDSQFISITDSWIHFKNSSNLIISTRRGMGEYPVDKIEKVFSSNFLEKKPKTYQFPKELESSLDRVDALAGVGEDMDVGASPMISLKREGNFLIVRGEKNVGDVEDKIEWKDKTLPEKIEIKASPDFLKKVLKITQEFQISSEKNSILFNAPNFRYVMVAMIK